MFLFLFLSFFYMLSSLLHNTIYNTIIQSPERLLHLLLLQLLQDLLELVAIMMECGVLAPLSQVGVEEVVVKEPQSDVFALDRQSKCSRGTNAPPSPRASVFALVVVSLRLYGTAEKVRNLLV